MSCPRPLVLCALAAGLFGACRKEAPDTAPVVRIIHPVEGSTLSVPDTFDVTLDVEDDIRVERVSVTLVDVDGVVMAPGVGMGVDAPTAQVTLRLPITDELLESGAYRLLVTASDGSGTARVYLPVQITAAPLRLRSIYVVSGDPTATVLQRIDSTGQLNTVNNWAMDLGGAAVDAPSATVFVAGGITGPLMGLAMDGQTLRWQQPGLGTPGLPYFTSVDRAQDGRLYVGRSDGYLRAFRPSDGSGLFTAPLNGIRTVHSIRMGGLVVSAVRATVPPERRIILHQSSSGTAVETQPLDKDPIALFQRSGDELLIFGNIGSQGVLEARNLSTGAQWEPRTWSAAITCVARVDAETWLVGLADGTLERYTWTGSSSLPIGSGAPLVDMAYDGAHGTVITASDASVQVIDPGTGLVITQWPAGPDVRRVLPLLNR
ncbi:MAG TPA: Ig-like domain-containing protein [Flavobacteriales bacterium]